jgi:purine-binding chemotaxis protein CheW
MDARDDAAPDDVLRFTIGELQLAVPAPNVREVQRAVALLALPGAPPIVEGVVDLRGTIVPVIDLRARLGLAPAAVAPSQYLLFLWTGERLVALRVDQVAWIEPLNATDIAAAGHLTRGSLRVAGVARTPDGLVLLQDPEALLRQAEAEAVDAALAELPAHR